MTHEERNSVHVFGGAKEEKFDWASDAVAIDLALFKPADRKFMKNGTPFAIDGDTVWFVYRTEKTPEQVVAVDVEAEKLAKLGELTKLIASTLVR